MTCGYLLSSKHNSALALLSFTNHLAFTITIQACSQGVQVDKNGHK